MKEKDRNPLSSTSFIEVSLNEKEMIKEGLCEVKINNRH